MATLPPPTTATVLRHPYRRVIFGEQVGLHQVGAREELVCRVNAVQVLARYIEEVGESGARADEDGVVAFREQLVHRRSLAYDGVRLHLRAQLLHVIDLALDDGLGQTEFGDAVNEHAPRLMEGLEDRHFMSLLGKLACNGKPGRPAADDGHPLAGRLRLFGAP